MLLSFAYMLDLSLGPANADWDRLALGTIGERLLVLVFPLASFSMAPRHASFL